MHKKKRKALIAAILFAFGIGMFNFPSISMRLSRKKQSLTCAVYSNDVQTIPQVDVTSLLEAAQLWNQALFTGTIDPMQPEENGYWQKLDPAGNGIMGVLHIPKIQVTLPIYHGTDAEVLALGAGHLPTTSLPIGGTSTHAAISAHSGMATVSMFDRLGELELGDTFYLEVLGQELWYTVDQIRVVWPTEIQDLKITEGADQVTLITCTPYGINTHRLLVRGARIERR